MSIQVLEPPPSTWLTSLEAVKLTLGITDNSQDELLGSLIASASDFVKSYTGRDFALQTVKESLAGRGLPDLVLSLTPIVEVEKVEFDDTEIDDWVILDKEAGFIQRKFGFNSTNIPYDTINRFPSNYEEKRWHVTYTGGYVLPSFGCSQGQRNLPYDLERAIIGMVKTAISSLQFDGTMKSYKIGDTTVTWDRTVSSSEAAGLSSLVPSSSLAVLNYYRRAF